MEVREPSAKYLAKTEYLCPPGYKQTEVGVIPEDWEVKLLEDVLSQGRLGGNYKNQTTPTDFPLMKMGNIARGKFDISKIEYITEGLIPDEAHQLKHGDVLFNTRNTLELVGKVAIWREELPTAHYNSNLMRLEFAHGEISSTEYANYAFNTSNAIARLAALATGTTSVAAIYTRDLLKFLFVVPPCAEQQAIAEALSDADALIELLNQLLAKKRQIKQGAMQELLTGQKRLPGFLGEWEPTRLGDVVQLRKERIDPCRARVQEFCIELEHINQGGGNLIGYSETTEDSSLKSVFQRDDVLFGKLRAYLEKYWLATRDGVCSTEIWVLVSLRALLLPQFLFQIVRTDSFIEVASTAYGTHMPRSDWNVVKNYEFGLPSIEEQTAIATVLSDLDAEIAALEARLAKAHLLKQGMMQELLTGRIRLV